MPVRAMLVSFLSRSENFFPRAAPMPSLPMRPGLLPNGIGTLESGSAKQWVRRVRSASERAVKRFPVERTPPTQKFILLDKARLVHVQLITEMKKIGCVRRR